MKRDECLQPLSRDHHEGLALARAIRWAVQGDRHAPRDPVALLRCAWDEVLDSHFREEEELLLPWMDAGKGDRLRRDHARLRELSRELLQGKANHGRLAAFSRELHEHIRWEERVLFPKLERDVPRSALDAIGRRLAAMEATRTREAQL